jgi:hypothetical protein
MKLAIGYERGVNAADMAIAKTPITVNNLRYWFLTFTVCFLY